MSLNRFVYYCAVTGGWTALLAWMVAEWLFFRANAWCSQMPSVFRDTLTAAIVGGVLSSGLWVVSGMTNAQWRELARRARVGLLGGLACGGLGGFVGTVLYSLYFSRSIGWLVMGTGIGVAEGLYERSARKTRNGLIGGALGGIFGGWLFESIAATRLEMSGRATAFAVLGISVGVLIGLAQLVLKEAWLTVLDGYRPGRQLIISKDVTILGRAEHLALPFLGYADGELEPQHAKIIRRPDGLYIIEDNATRLGTLVNLQRIHGPVNLRDNDLIKLGTNIVRFNLRRREAKPEETAPMASDRPGKKALSPPPPPPTSTPPLSQSPTAPPQPPPPAVVFHRPVDAPNSAQPTTGECLDTGHEVGSDRDVPPKSDREPGRVGFGPMRPPPPPPSS